MKNRSIIIFFQMAEQLLKQYFRVYICPSSLRCHLDHMLQPQKLLALFWASIYCFICVVTHCHPHCSELKETSDHISVTLRASYIIFRTLFTVFWNYSYVILLSFECSYMFIYLWEKIFMIITLN